MGYAAVNSEKKRFRAFMNKNPSKAQVIARIKKIMSGKGEKSALKFEVMKFGLENYFNRGDIRLEGIRNEMINLQVNLYLKKNLGFYDIREGEMRGGFDIPQDKIDDFARNTKQYLSPKKKKAPKPPTPTPTPPTPTPPTPPTPPTSPGKDIRFRKAYRRAMLKIHPNKNPNARNLATEITKELTNYMNKVKGGEAFQNENRIQGFVDKFNRMKAAPPSPSPPPTRKRKPAAKKTGKEKTKAAKEKARAKAAKEKARAKAAKEKAKAKAVKEKARAKAKAVKEKAKAKAAKEKEKARDKAKANAAKKKYEKDRVKFFAAKKKAMAKAKAKVKANAEKRMKCLKPFRLAFKQFLKAKNKYKKCSGLSENNNNDEIYKARNQIY